MALRECPDCEQQVSDQAAACPKCGRPAEATGETSGSWSGAWQAVGKTRTPINVFALAMMACAAVFGVSSIQVEQATLPAFTYSLHTFITIAGMFFVILLFCRNAIYHPDDLATAKKHGVDLGEDKPVVAAVLIGVMMIAYGCYQAFLAGELMENTGIESSRPVQAAETSE